MWFQKIMLKSISTVAATSAVAAAAVYIALRLRRAAAAAEEVEEDAYCQPCNLEQCPPAQRQRSHQLQREMSSETLLRRQQSSLIDDDDFQQGWSRYRREPSMLFGSKGFSDVGVQRIDLPFGAHELDKVAAWLDDAEQSAMGALRPLHRLQTPERLQEWKQHFDSLDLGGYDELTANAAAAGAEHLAALGWSILLIEPNRFFPCHKHPNVEVIYCARGALYENRVLGSALVNRPRSEKAKLIDSGFPRFFRVNKHVGGSVLCNPRFSVHQSYTLDEGAVLLVLWCGKHANLSDPDHLMWDPSRCQNPLCPLACPDGTFEALARNSGSRRVAEV